MLLQPFAAAVALSRRFDWVTAAALAGVLLCFIVREPLLALARQRWVWRERKPESAEALRCLMWELPLLTLCGVVLWMKLPRGPLLALGCGAAVMTAVAVWMALKNRQRSVALQIASTISLGAASLAAALAATRELPRWSWALWALVSLHGVSAVFVVHARLAVRSGRDTAMMRRAWIAQFAQAPAAVLLGILAGAWAPVVFSMAANSLELWRLRNPRNLNEPLPRVGWRTLSAAVAHAALCVVVLW
jgi:hypothetical protein